MRERPEAGQQIVDGYASALRLLDEQNVAASQVSRVQVDRKGRMHIEADGEISQRWFLYKHGRIAERFPEQEELLPYLASRNTGPGTDLDDELISYRPEKRIVYHHQSNDRGCFIKAFKRHQSTQAIANHRLAAAACARHSFQVPELLDYSPSTDSFVLREVQGIRPSLEEGTEPVWRQIGHCLRVFQTVVSEPQLATHGIGDELALLDERARRYLLCMPTLPMGWERARGLIEQSVPRLSGARVCLTHRDLHDGQLLVGDQGIGLLDFDLLCLADNALDAGNLIAHIYLRAMQGGWHLARVDACSQAFLAGLNREQEVGFKARLTFYQASSQLRLALIYALRPRWSKLCNELIDHALDLLGALNANTG